MSDTRGKTPKQDELRRLEERLIEEILSVSPDDLRNELREAGEDPEAMITLGRKMFADAKTEAAHVRLIAAKKSAAAFRATEGAVTSLDSARRRLASARAGTASGLMMAARKGDGLSESDEEALLEAMAELERLEAEQGTDE